MQFNAVDSSNLQNRLPPPCEKCDTIADLPLSLVHSEFVPEYNISSIQTLISSCGAELCNLQLATTLLQSRISNICAFQRSLLSPVRRLPDELLGEIFTHGHEAIWDLQQVCTRWRRVVRSIPSLWRRFEMTVRKINIATVNLRVQWCLKFSGMASLSIEFPWPDPGSGFPPGIHADIANHADRWASITFSEDVFSEAMENTSMGDIIKQRGLSKLHKLSIYAKKVPFSYDIFQAAPALEEVNLHNLLTLPGVSKLPWAGIRRLVVEECDLFLSGDGDNTISALCAMSSLEELTWRENCTSKSIPETQVITLPLLRTFTIQDPFGEDAGARIWHMFRMPSLTNLQFTLDKRDFDHFLFMTRTSACAVTKLLLDGCSTNFILDAIEEFSNVEELSLMGMNETQDVLPMLIWDPMNHSSSNSEPAKLLPSLRVLKLVFYDLSFEDFPPELTEIILSVTEIMRSRSIASSAMSDDQQPLTSPLTSVKISLSRHDLVRYTYPLPLAHLINLGEDLGMEVEVDID
ncbi:hypothetical protein BDQ17DRAFT_1345649 [Cyathus striatus]|nr:hypothetical protein BDQ17DRAFT_1345649 [Cyathus striatus]